MVFSAITFMFLFISNAYATGCLDNYNDELHHYILLNSDVEKTISELGLDKQTAVQYRKSIANDPIGIEIEQSKKCLESMNDTAKTDNFNSSFSYPFIGAVIGGIVGAVVVIIGTEKIQHRRIQKNGKIAISNELQQIRQMLEQKVEFTDAGTTFRYSPYDLSTTAFDSVISSGTFLHFPIELQQSLVIIYFHIKEHNTLMQKLANLIIKTQTETVLPQTAQVLIRYYEEIVINESRVSERYLGRFMQLL